MKARTKLVVVVLLYLAVLLAADEVVRDIHRTPSIPSFAAGIPPALSLAVKNLLPAKPDCREFSAGRWLKVLPAVQPAFGSGGESSNQGMWHLHHFEVAEHGTFLATIAVEMAPQAALPPGEDYLFLFLYGADLELLLAQASAATQSYEHGASFFLSARARASESCSGTSEPAILGITWVRRIAESGPYHYLIMNAAIDAPEGTSGRFLAPLKLTAGDAADTNFQGSNIDALIEQLTGQLGFPGETESLHL